MPATKKRRASKKDYVILENFTYIPKKGPYKGRYVCVGLGEDIPSDVLDNDELRERLLSRGRIAVRGKNGEVERDKRQIVLTERQIQGLVTTANLDEIKRVTEDRRVTKDSLINLSSMARHAKAPQNVLDMIDKAVER